MTIRCLGAKSPCRPQDQCKFCWALLSQPQMHFIATYERYYNFTEKALKICYVHYIPNTKLVFYDYLGLLHVPEHTFLLFEILYFSLVLEFHFFVFCSMHISFSLVHTEGTEENTTSSPLIIIN